MKPNVGITLIGFLILLGCKTSKQEYRALIPKDNTFKNERRNKLLAFVGKKLEFRELPYEEGSMDNSYYAKYQVLQRVYGHYQKDTIEFVAYSHKGIPKFSNYENVLLYVTKYAGKYYHEKYQFDAVYKTKSGSWAGKYSDDYSHSDNENTTVRPEKIEFVEKLSFPIKVRESDGEEYEGYYPEPYYRILGDTAVTVFGNHVEELFRLKKEGVLTARQLFGNQKAHIIIHDVQLEDIKRPYNEDDLKFITFWHTLSNSIRQSGVKALKEISFDSLWACTKIYGSDKFFNVCYPNLFTDKMIRNLSDTLKLNFTWAAADFPSLSTQAKQSIIKVGRIYRFREVKIKDEATKDTFVIEFIETATGYRFYGVDYGERKKCCH